MKSKIVGYVLSAVFIIGVLWLVFRVTALKNFVTGSTTPAATT